MKYTLIAYKKNQSVVALFIEFSISIKEKSKTSYKISGFLYYKLFLTTQRRLLVLLVRPKRNRKKMGELIGSVE